LCCFVYCLCVNVQATVLLPPGDNPIAVNKYIISYQIFSINFEEIPALDRSNFEEQNKDWEPFVTVINYCIVVIIIINVY